MSKPQQPLTAWIPASCLAYMVREGKRTIPNEAGGVLMGFWPSENTVVITHVIGPGPSARHTRYAFHPDLHFHDQEIERIYIESGRIITYLGDWHTHPQGGSSTSQRDCKTLLNIACAAEALAPKPLMAILSIRRDCALAIWHWEGKHFLWNSRVAAGEILIFE
jgi:integrative and conjugative element protein (TIGR02256 family)